MCVVAEIRDEMALALKMMSDPAELTKTANARLARRIGLPVGTIERLRWRKVNIVPAHVADAVRTALLEHVENQEARARHDAAILRTRLARATDLAGTAADPIGADRGSGCAADRAVGMGRTK